MLLRMNLRKVTASAHAREDDVFSIIIEKASPRSRRKKLQQTSESHLAGWNQEPNTKENLAKLVKVLFDSCIFMNLLICFKVNQAIENIKKSPLLFYNLFAIIPYFYSFENYNIYSKFRPFLNISTWRPRSKPKPFLATPLSLTAKVGTRRPRIARHFNLAIF